MNKSKNGSKNIEAKPQGATTITPKEFWKWLSGYINQKEEKEDAIQSIKNWLNPKKN